ncbi:ATP synthase F1 subunit gamma [Candidatus Gottesmanbacteria bacterium RIFCSPLOWO2_01_FULL_49_10]|uniref:ATP synthase gamma chain n=1 Tax=Candidatus Gottesmanbacteria bacterium RIFCSPLOWO2_01_FULL_49_10 TaxID=1798396 RepID=A0A1F6B0Z2_9BACT|nr:MAG: ATP synthase F1 subunit gamma [Candidatus Gottesmanbacteria bacterium RIFCSPLOWO2_01_FULL_49_10]
MANIRLIKRRIKSAKNIAQITRAMELVAASRMKKAQLQALAGKAYAQKIYEMVVRLSPRVDSAHHELLGKSKSTSGKRLVVLLTTNKGLCGCLNTTLFRFLAREYPDLARDRYIVVGKKGAYFLSHFNAQLLADFSDRVPFVSIVPAVSALVTTEYLKNEIDSVELVYNEFISALKQVPRRKTILPLSVAGGVAPEKRETGEILIEPNPEEVFRALIPHYLENQIRDAILEAEASEHSARMIAMRNATDNATGLVSDLTLVYNKARQEKITYEITDMVTARLAVEV